MSDTADVDVNAIQRAEMARQITLMAARMRDTADRLDRYSGQLTGSAAPAASIAADALNDYTAVGNGIAPIVWGIVRELGRTT